MTIRSMVCFVAIELQRSGGVNARPPFYQTTNSTYTGLQIVLVSTSDVSRNRIVARAGKKSEQELIASMVAVLRVGTDWITVPGENQD